MHHLTRTLPSSVRSRPSIPLASSSRLFTTTPFCRNFNPTLNAQHDDLESRKSPQIPDQLIGTREQLERKRKEVEERYGVKLRKKMKEENTSNLAELKKKVDLLKAKHAPPPPPAATTSLPPSPTLSATEPSSPSAPDADLELEKKRARERREIKRKMMSQAEGDRSGIKPLSQILNLDLLYSPPANTPLPTTTDITRLWTAYHTAHPTLSSTFLSATITPSTYKNMLQLARENPVFVLPLPKSKTGWEGKELDRGAGGGYEFFFLQWTFHPTPSASTSVGENTAEELERKVEKMQASSVMFTPLEEYKKKGEWAKPFLVLTHYPDLHNNPINPSPSSPSAPSAGSAEDEPPQPIHHPLILMRGEISPSETKSPLTSPLPGIDLSLTQQEAQLLSLGLQRFYCLDPGNREDGEKAERLRVLRGFGRDREWGWEGLVRLAYGGIV